MITTVAIVTRRLKEGKNYDDFRRAWYHTTGFGTKNRMFTFVNISDPREITVIGMTVMDPDDLMKEFMVDVHERLAHPLDDVIEPGIVRKYGLLLSEDDFSANGSITYQPPSVEGKESDPAWIFEKIAKFGAAISEASGFRDRAKENTGREKGLSGKK